MSRLILMQLLDGLLSSGGGGVKERKVSTWSGTLILDLTLTNPVTLYNFLHLSQHSSLIPLLLLGEDKNNQISKLKELKNDQAQLPDFLGEKIEAWQFIQANNEIQAKPGL